MKFDKHHIQCEIRCDGMRGAAACCDGKVGPLWERMKQMAGDKPIIGWTFWVTLRRGPIEITAHGSDNYTTVLQRAERILLAAEKAFKAEHQEPAHVQLEAC
jgi:hypothetical protein